MALIEVKNVAKIYGEGDAETAALDGVSFNIKEGEFIAIMGPSGSGKSTLLHILGLLDKPTRGEYRFDGKSIDDYSKEEIAHIRNRKMGFVFQTFNLLSRTPVSGNVELPLIYSGIKEELWEKMALDVVEKVGLSHRIHHKPSQLSGVEQQRAAIARALVLSPRVVFADEPTGNLDSKSGQAIMSILQKLNDEKRYTIILITHESYTAEHAERIIHIRDGKIESDSAVDNRRKADRFFK